MSKDKVRENRLRRMAQRRRCQLVKSRRRDPLAWEYGTYSLLDAETREVIIQGARIEDVETWLRYPMTIHVDRGLVPGAEYSEPLDFADTNGEPIVSWVNGSHGGWYVYVAWDDDPLNAGGSWKMTDEEVIRIASEQLGWHLRG